MLDTHKMGRYWSLQSWLLRLIFLPLLLLAIGNLLIDWAFMHWVSATTRTIVIVYEGLWWILGAHLFDMAIRRFVWIPLEENAGRKVPNVMKVIVTILIFALAFAGIIAVVLNQTLTSLLATSGVLAMVVGFAVQSNIANVFSGIILNIERPFKVGDTIKINNVIGEVTDITWRTIRLESFDGPMVILANSKVSEAFIENLSAAPFGVNGETVFYTQPNVDNKLVQKLIQEAIANNPVIVFKDDPIYKPSARFRGIVNIEGTWVATFTARYRVKVTYKKSNAQEELWNEVREKFIEHGIALTPTTTG
jgi:small-conductance mechanosensitive channel